MDNGRMFVNPYNFVPLGDGSKRKLYASASETITGEIVCTLEIKTPLAIPDTEKQTTKKEVVKKYDFMSVAGKYIIPGSEIRGMIRNIYETITDSCLSVINSNIITKRESTPLKETGLLKWEGSGWKLYKASRSTAYSNVTISNTTYKLSGKRYVVRNWYFFTGLDLAQWKKTINEAIASSDDFESFKDMLAEKKMFVVNNGHKDDKNSLTIKKGKTRVNITRKWGPHYSRSGVKKAFGNKPLGDEYTEESVNCSFFEIDEKSKPFDIQDSMVENLIEVLESYALYNQKNSKVFDNITPKKDGDMYPAFYSVGYNGAVSRLAPAQISRVAFRKTVRDLLGSYAPCKDITSLCSGCNLFGAVLKNGSKASRVRFTDAVPNGKITFSDKYIPLKVLSSPKVTSVEFYSLPSEIDSYVDVKKWDYDSQGVVLRGRKFYLHNPKAAVDSSVYSESESVTSSKGNALNASFKLATSGEFTFKVFFDRITKDELKSLVWSLVLGNRDKTEKCYCHKLGHGKPLGLGSVLISVDKIKKRTTKDGYSLDNIDIDCLMKEYAPPIIGTPTYAALMAICDYDYAKDENIAYPIGKNNKGEENAMHWFSLNHGAIGSKQPFKHVLHPVIGADDNRCDASYLQLPNLVYEEVSSDEPTQNTNTRSSNKLNYVSANTYQISDKFEDKPIVCSNCHKTFVWTAGEQEYYRSKNYYEPKKCKTCRAAEKRKKGNNK